MTSIPTKFTFMNQSWSIDLKHSRDLGTDMGQCDPNTCEITIDPGLTESMMCQTLWHEIIHSWEQTLQLDIPERTVDLLALSLVHFFKTNPEFLTTFTEEGPDNDYQ